VLRDPVGTRLDFLHPGRYVRGGLQVSTAQDLSDEPVELIHREVRKLEPQPLGHTSGGPERIRAIVPSSSLQDTLAKATQIVAFQGVVEQRFV